MDAAGAIVVSLGIVLVFGFYAVVIGLILWLLFLIIRAAVRGAMDEHYRKQQWLEATGLWYSGRPPKGLPGAELLTKQERKDLPKDEQPE